MNHVQVTRRSFLKKSAALAAGALAAPQIVPSPVLGNPARAAASERITVGWIGTGHRGSEVIKEFLAQKEVQVVAACDVKKWMLDAAKQRIDKHYGGNACSAYKDFRELVARKDIDAVLVASTDHWHVLHSINAARSGKDVYMEKPMGLSMAECQALRQAFKKGKRIFQFGTQQRSDGKFRLACELARNEKIGKLHTINVWSPGSASGGPTNVVSVPEGLDYDFWLGPASFKPHTQDRSSNQWWWFISDYALGFIAGWGIHPMDIASWGAGDKIDCPVEIEGKGDFPKAGLCDTATNWRIAMKFASGLTINFDGDPKREEWSERYPGHQSHGTAFEGAEGWVHVNRSVINSKPEGLIRSKIGAEGVRLYRSDNHVRNFLDSVKSRKPAVCDLDEAFRSEMLCQISEIAIRLGRKVRWDPKTESFPGDEEANRRLSRPMRSPWSLATA
ncbi:MAG: Gfo/Idh/MocA family oxidoreductase [Planctomycetes bacterium]|nr:Gfo/Idh/MocA family oxidoreductase [Planctomycetota bacterium]